MFCPLTAADRPPSLAPARASETARAKEPNVRFPVQLCCVSKYNSESSFVPSPSRCIFAILCDPPAHFRRCPRGCCHASGLLRTPPRTMRFEPALCGSMIPPNRCYAHLLGTVAVAMASSRHPLPRPRCLPHHRHTNSMCLWWERLGGRSPAGSDRQRLAHIHRDYASRRPMCSTGPSLFRFSLCCCRRACPCPAPILQSPNRRTSHAARRQSAGRFHQPSSQPQCLSGTNPDLSSPATSCKKLRSGRCA